MTKSLLTLLMAVLILSACQVPDHTDQLPTSTATAVPSATFTVSPTATERVAAQPTDPPPTATSTPASLEVCSPLEDETFDSLPLIVSNPIDIPGFGQDTGHHGVDFAYFKRGDRNSIDGVEVYAILSGTTVLTLDDDNPNHPYGYTVLLETRLEYLPKDIQTQLMAGYLEVPEDPHYRLYCPEVVNPEVTRNYSIYHLYAHLSEIPSFNRGDFLPCGKKLGTVGNTGQSTHSHLHLETRLGPSGASFTNMAHYDNYTYEELSNYCLWRMSGYYQLFDPFFLFDAAE